jgi:hypothetical protein
MTTKNHMTTTQKKLIITNNLKYTKITIDNDH